MVELLFVDSLSGDSPAGKAQAVSLALLGQVLAHTQPDWKIRTVATVDMAIEQLVRRPAQVVLAQLDDAALSFPRLFAAVSHLCPAAIRLAAVSAGSAASAAMSQQLPAQVPLAHQCMPAGMEASRAQIVLSAAVAVAERLQGNPELARVICHLKDVPSPPALYFDIREQLQARDGTVSQMAAIAERDPALVARVLKIANSGFFGLPRSVNDLSAAIGMIGTDALLSLVLSSHLYAGLPPPGLNLDVLWRHALEVSKLARDIAKAEGGSRAEQNSAGTAGLLHDVGLMVLLQNESARYQPLWRRAAGDEAQLVQLERAQFGVDHGELGALVLMLWTLPADVVLAVAHSHGHQAGVPALASRAVLAAEWLLGPSDVPFDAAGAPPALTRVATPAFAESLQRWQHLRSALPARAQVG